MYYIKKFFVFLMILLTILSCSEDKSAEKTQENQGKDKIITEDGDPASTIPKDQQTDIPTPEEIAARFIKASNAKDIEKFEHLLTPKAYECIDRAKFTDRTYEDVEIGASEITDNEAQVPVTCSLDEKKGQMKLLMRKAEGNWRIHSLNETDENGTEITINLEKLCDAFENAARRLQKTFADSDSAYEKKWIAEKIAEYDALVPVNPNVFDTDWQLNPDSRDKQVKDVIESLIKPLGLTLFAADCEAALLEKITIRRENISRLELIETILNKVGCYPVYPDISLGGFRQMGELLTETASEVLTQEILDKEILDEDKGALKIENNGESFPLKNMPGPDSFVVRKGTRPYPVIFTGPLMIEIEKVVENVPLATGAVTILIWGTDINPSALAMLKGKDSKAAIVENITDDKNNSLVQERTEGYFPPPEVVGSMFRLEKTILLKGLYQSVKDIQKIIGVMKFEYPVSIHEEKLRVADMKTSGGIQLSLDKLYILAKYDGTQSVFDIEGPSGLLKNMDIRFYPADAEDTFIGTFLTGTSHTFSSTNDTLPGIRSYTLQTRKAPASVSFKLLTEIGQIEYPFEFENIPLTSYDKMPRGIVALDFKGHDAPVSISFIRYKYQDVRLSKEEFLSKVVLNLKNHSNKNILKIETDFEYLDKAGNKIIDLPLPHDIGGTLTMSGQQDPLVEKNTEKEIETNAFFLPEQAVDLKVRIKSVEFEDYTRWDAK